ncbi:MAG: BamA/TamA family outer membrane protein, partial [Gammaproteobacteria bacterium]|nr:BamA/TamA family outer membrane protein [Gammaproteobacteria bacterium]
VSTPLLAGFEVPERRKSQFFTDPGYYVVPTPYSIPGLGEGLIVVGAMTNYSGYSDIYGFAAAGDLEGLGFFSTENHLLEEELIIDFALQNFNKASSQIYTQRGMGTDPDDYILAELDNALFYGARLTYTLDDRRKEFYAMIFDNEAKAGALRNPDGSLIQDASDAETTESRSITVGVRLDFTDDYSDPRKGIRLEASFWHSPPLSQDSPNYNIIDLNFTGYIPFSNNDTIVLNYFQADTDVNRSGETDSAVIQANNGLDCSAAGLTAEQQQDCLSFINNIIAANTFGSVGALGGLSRLRSFPEVRFTGSHARFYGVEYRWNINDDEKPFDILIAKDIRTVMQLAFFYERGAIADDKSQLWDEMVYSAGVGFRMVTSSGLVFRADIAAGDEGSEVSVIIGYPWEVF